MPGMPVRPYNNRAGKWKDGGLRKAEDKPVKSDDKPLKPSASNKWYLGKDGLVHIVKVGKFHRITELTSFKEGEGTSEQDALLAAATEDQELAN